MVVAAIILSMIGAIFADATMGKNSLSIWTKSQPVVAAKK